MERRVQEAYNNRTAFHGFEDTEEIFLLERKYFLQRVFSCFLSVRHNHGAEVKKFILIKEHVFCAAKANTLSAELKRALGVTRLIRVSPHIKALHLSPY